MVPGHGDWDRGVLENKDIQNQPGDQKNLTKIERVDTLSGVDNLYPDGKKGKAFGKGQALPGKRPVRRAYLSTKTI
jgi:hypothetical protein